MVNQFEVLDDGRRAKPSHHNNEQRGDFGATAIFIFSPNFHEIVTVYGSRFDNRKVPSGGIEERDFASSRSSIAEAAERGALRECTEETRMTEDLLVGVCKSSVEDVIRGKMMRYYFIAIAKERCAITPFRSKEDGKDRYVDHQRWEPVADVLCGASHSGERYNTHYSIALLKIIQEMKEWGYDNDSGFVELLRTLRLFSETDFEDQLKVLTARREGEEESRRQRQYS